MNKYILIVSIAFFFSCSENNNVEEADKTKSDTTQKIIEIDSCALVFEQLDTFPKINYQTTVIKDWKEYTELKSKYKYSKDNKEANKAFITLNRKEFRFVKVGDSVIVPDKIIGDMRAYSIFPPYYCDAKHLEKLIVVSNKYQCYAAYENGKLVRFAAANTGKEKTPTFPGRYALVWKDRIRKSSLDSTWVLPYTWNFHRYAGNAFHQFTMPGRAVSHSCVRQFMSDARWLYNWGSGVKVDSNRKQIWLSGTPVIITGMFDYDRKVGPWLDLVDNKTGRIELKGDPMEVEEAYIPIQQIPEEIQGWIPNRKRYVAAEDTLIARGVIDSNIRLIPSVNFNKRRREREAKKRKDSIKNAQQSTQSTDIDLIKQNLEQLEGKEIDIKKDSTEKK